MKILSLITSILSAFLLLPLPISAQPFWTEFTYTDWSPGEEPAIAAPAGEEAFHGSITWDGDRFLSFLRWNDTDPYLAAFSSDGQDWDLLNGENPISVTGLFIYPMGDHTVAAAPEGFPAAETAWGDQAGNVRFKLWYANADSSPGEHFQYAESTDGVTWQAFTEGHFCPPSAKTDPNRVLSRPSVLYRPRGLDELTVTSPMNNRYLMYLQSGLEDEPYYYELYLSSNGLDWTLYASDWHAQSRTPGQAVTETVTFSGNTDGPGYLNTFEEVYYYGERQGWMLWTTEDDDGPISSWYSANGWNWFPREEPINGIGSANPEAGYWNEEANSRLSSIRLGTSYFFLRTGRNDGGTRQLGAGIKKGLLSAEVENLPNRVWGQTPVHYRLYSWNNQTCPLIEPYCILGPSITDAFEGSGGDGKNNLPSSIGGTPLTYIWDVNKNYPNPPGSPILFRIHPAVSLEPKVSGEYDTTEPFAVAPDPSPSPSPTPEGYKTPPPTATPVPTASPPPTASPTLTPDPSPPPTASPTPSPIPRPGLPWIYDYNADGTSDIGIFRPSTGLWAIRGLTRIFYGEDEDLLVPADYTGDGTTEIAIFRPSDSRWAIRGVTDVYFGAEDDQPVPGDYTGDGTSNFAIYRPSTGLWAIRGLTRFYYGSAADLPVPGYYSGLGKREIAVFRPSTGLWAVRGQDPVFFGRFGDRPLPGDYNGDGTWSPAVFRPDSGLWGIRGVTRLFFGVSSDKTVPGDYSGDGTDDIAIFRESTGLWGIRGVTRLFFGRFDDIPVSR